MVLTLERILLTDRVAVVTGAAVGIGAATASALASFGARVALVDRDAENLERVVTAIDSAVDRPRGEAMSAVFDVRDGVCVSEFIGRVVQRFGRIDILVNNAGGGFKADLMEVSDKGQDALVRENFTSVTHFVRAVVPHMKAGSTIVNVTSIEAHRAAPGFAVYAAMKAAVANLTKSLALELGARQIRVNCVAPDGIPTPGIGGEIPVHTPLPRPGDVDDVAGAIVFLASDMSGYVTGSTLHVDGGNLAASGWRRRPGGFET